MILADGSLIDMLLTDEADGLVRQPQHQTPKQGQ